MDQTISAREANQRFSELLQRAASGEAVTITKHGKPVARLVPVVNERQRRDEAWTRFLALLDEGHSLGGEKFDRESLYDDR